ncbi:GGDEF domain-containing protein [Anaeromyxobacter sp. Red801]|uniref:GGDEF domain-containing protein n=1 Tax=Anaeromyxobacter sp. Red801 TaxID=3411632 RepID=UPI003BA3C6D1
MPRRILVAEASAPLLAPLRRPLRAAGVELDAISPAAAAGRLGPATHVAAIVPGGVGGAEAVRAVRAADPLLPVIALFADEAEAAAAAQGEALGADGALVAPVGPAAVVGACRLAERLRAATARAVEADARRLAAEAPRHAADLEFLKRLLPLEVKRSRRYGYPVSVALVAVDRFAEVAGRLGPHGRTAVLAEVLGLLAASVRDIDLAAPFAGERFVVLMPHTRAEGGLQVARRLCARIRERGAGEGITVSAGVAGHDGGGTVSFGGLVKRAAEALTRARAAGGDRAEPADPPRPRDRIVMG